MVTPCPRPHHPCRCVSVGAHCQCSTEGAPVLARTDAPPFTSPSSATARRPRESLTLCSQRTSARCTLVTPQDSTCELRFVAHIIITRPRPACRLRTSLAGCDEGRGFGASRPAPHVHSSLPPPFPRGCCRPSLARAYCVASNSGQPCREEPVTEGHKGSFIVASCCWGACTLCC